MERVQLLADLLTAFNETELADLCGQLGIEYRSLAGSSAWDRSRSLIAQAEANDLVAKLVEQVVAAKPELDGSYPSEDVLDWIDRLVPEASVPVEELPTLKWPGREKESTLGAANDGVPAGRAPTEEIPTMTWPDELETAAGAIWDGEEDGGEPYSERDLPWFIGRKRERLWLTRQLGQITSCAVVGAPKIGKSALLRFFDREQVFPPELKILFAYLDLDDAAYQSGEGVHNGALAAWYGRLLDAPPPMAPTLSDFQRQIRNLHEAGFRPILGLDGVEKLLGNAGGLDEALFEAWHQMAQAGQLTFLVSAERSLTEIDGAPSSFVGLFVQLELGLLGEIAAMRLLADEVRSRKGTLRPAWRKPLLRWCGRHPHFLKIAAEVVAEKLDADYDVMIGRLRRRSEKSWQALWDSLSARQQLLLSAEIPVDPPLVLARQYQKLAERGVVIEQDGKFELFSQGFGDWLAGRR